MKQIFVIDRINQERQNADPVTVSDTVYKGMCALGRYRSDHNQNNGADINAMVQLADVLSLPETSKWIQSNEDEYFQGLKYGFVLESQFQERQNERLREEQKGNLKKFMEVYVPEDDKKGISIVKNAIVKNRSMAIDKLVKLLMDKKITKKGYMTARSLLSGLISKLRKEGYWIDKIKKKYVLKGIDNDLLKKYSNSSIINLQRQEEIMSNESVNEVEITESDEGVSTGKKSRTNTMRQAVENLLRGESLTKKQLAKILMEQGMTSLSDLDALVRSLGVMFHKMKKEGVNLVKTDLPREGRGRPEGSYRILVQ